VWQRPATAHRHPAKEALQRLARTCAPRDNRG